MQLTSRQQEVLSFLRAHQQRHGAPPTRAEIATHFGFRSANAAEEHLRALARKGAIALKEGAARGIDLFGTQKIHLTPPRNTLPVVGQVAAGTPILAAENISSECAIDGNVFRPKADYLLRVRGTSMRNIGIFDGDLLAVQRTQDVHNGEIVVVRINDEVTVKRLQIQGAQLTLLSENPEFAPIKIDLNTTEAVIEGRAVGVIRPFGGML